ncbi:MAG: XkdQ/YqbQ family protein [Fusobacteriaceae bacterium]
MIISVNGIRYQKMFQEIEWSGSLEGSARSLKVTHLKDMKVSTGDIVEFFNLSGYRLFIGRVFVVELESKTQMMSFTAFDNAIYLNKNRFVKNFYNKKPSEITKEICGEIGLSTGILPHDYGQPFSYPAIEKTGYDIILTAYTLQHRKDKKIYSIVSNDGLIEVVEQGTVIENIKLSSTLNIIESRYSESIENMINQIVVYQTEKEKLQIKEKVQESSDIGKYGVFQEVLQYTDDNKALINPKAMLKGLDRKSSVKVLGHNDLISGYTVVVDEPNISLAGAFLISEDRHIWTSGIYTTELTLSFENTMQKTEVDTFVEKSEKKKKPKTEKVKIQSFDQDKYNKLTGGGK